MPAPPLVRAHVVDIQADVPQTNDVFFADAHVWYWFAYPRAGLVRNPPDAARVTAYLSYTAAALNAQAALVRTGVTLMELATIIGNAEWEICNINRVPQIGKKVFRYDAHNRRAVVTQIRAAWRFVVDASHHVDIGLGEIETRRVLSRLSVQPVDGQDALVINALRAHGISQIISDDADFAAVRGIQMFTANADVLAAAVRQDRLLVR